MKLCGGGDSRRKSHTNSLSLSFALSPSNIFKSSSTLSRIDLTHLQNSTNGRNQFEICVHKIHWRARANAAPHFPKCLLRLLKNARHKINFDVNIFLCRLLIVRQSANVIILFRWNSMPDKTRHGQPANQSERQEKEQNKSKWGQQQKPPKQQRQQSINKSKSFWH